jgi:enediyne biosynthesis protein E4
MDMARKFLLIAAVTALAYYGAGRAMDSPGRDGLSRFEEIPVAHKHVWSESTHPFTGAAVIDVDGDGKMEIFVGGGQGQADALLSYRAGQLINMIEGIGLSRPSATYGAVSIDMDNDGDVDLIVARNDGVYLYLNEKGRFSERKIPLTLLENSVPLNVAVSDIDRDGDGDLYISVFVDFPSFRSGVFNDPAHAKANVLLLNNGDLTFTDITKASGTAGKQNTFVSVFVDLDADGWQDLVLAQNTGEVEIFRNNRDRTFTAMALSSGYGFWMGLAVGDIDDDGDQDLFFSNVGSSIPAFLTKGDIRKDQRHNLEWLLLRNDGDFRFADVTANYGITGEGFAWGAVFEDLNLDGRLDLLVAQNYIKWPVHKWLKLPGRSYLQTASGGRFQHAEALGLENRFYGQSPLIVDLDNDGRPDVMWVNMNGPVRAFLNRSRHHYLSISVPDRVVMLGARVRIETSRGSSHTKEIVTSTGLMTDQSPDLVFGLGDGDEVKRVVITYADGANKIIESPPRGTRISLQP